MEVSEPNQFNHVPTWVQKVQNKYHKGHGLFLDPNGPLLVHDSTYFGRGIGKKNFWFHWGIKLLKGTTLGKVMKE